MPSVAITYLLFLVLIQYMINYVDFFETITTCRTSDSEFVCFVINHAVYCLLAEIAHFFVITRDLATS